MRRKGIILLIALVVVLGAGGVVGVSQWKSYVTKRLDERAFETAQKALSNGDPTAAWTLFRQHRTESPLDWGSIEIGALAGLRDLSRLSTIYEARPARILANEPASLLLGRAFMHANRAPESAKIRESWKGREKDEVLWMALDVDKLFLAGKAREAEKILRGKQFQGTNDVWRLVRLAIASGSTDATAAWNYLADANRLEPRNPDVRSFRGQMLERAGKSALARVEYVAALVADPRNPLLRDQLAEFYRRQGDYDLALRTWRETLKETGLDFTWLKVAFWERMVGPVESQTDPTAAAPGPLKAFAQGVLGFPAGTFWNTNLVSGSAQANKPVLDRQEAFWLQLAQELVKGREGEALKLIQYNRFRQQSWAPELENALQRVLLYRQSRSLNPAGSLAVMSSRPEGAGRHQFFNQLEELAKAQRADRAAAIPAATDAFLRGPDAFSGLFLAAGWREAALQLRRSTKLPADYPEWYGYGLAQCLRLNRGYRDALELASALPQSALNQLLEAELLLASGSTDKAIPTLERIAVDPSDAGYRAAWLRATLAMEKKQYPQARDVVKKQPRLDAQPAGAEIVARSFLLEGNTNQAARVYESVAANSAEAKTFLARQAFARKDWAAARKYTEELLAMFPDELELRSNLLAIERAQAGK